MHFGTFPALAGERIWNDALTEHRRLEMNLNDLFSRFARWTGRVTAQPVTFFLAIMVVLVWGVTGPIFGFSDTWQLVINTGTTIITFLMVFLIQNTQNRDTEAMHLKLDELIRAVRGANNVLIDLENDTEEDLDEIKAKYQEVAEKAKEGAKAAMVTGTPPIEIKIGNTSSDQEDEASIAEKKLQLDEKNGKAA